VKSASDRPRKKKSKKVPSRTPAAARSRPPSTPNQRREKTVNFWEKMIYFLISGFSNIITMVAGDLQATFADVSAASLPTILM